MTDSRDGDASGEAQTSNQSTTETNMSDTTAETTETATTDNCATCDSLTRRRFMAATGAAALAATGSAAADDTTESASETTVAANDLAFDSDYVHAPYLTGTVSVDEVGPDMAALEYVADNEEVADLAEDAGFALARQPDDEDTPHNPVTTSAANFEHPELTAFPRDTVYDSDSDGDIDDEDEEVVWHDPTHWTTTDATDGSISLSEGEGDSLVISTSSVASGETVKASFDLSSVGNSDATITDGMSRKFLQVLADIDSLPAGVVVEAAVIDSGGSEVTATADPSGDTATDGVMFSSTGASKVAQPRVGDLEDAQGVTLDDIETVEIRVKETDADLTLHGLNLERATEWTFGTEEYQTTNDDGETVVDTQAVTSPSGEFSITGLDTLSDTPFADATIRGVTYDVEVRASDLPNSRVWARLKDTPDTYSYPKELETVFEFETPSAYALDINLSGGTDEVLLPAGRFLSAGVAKAISDIEEWEDIEESISWTDRTSTYTDASPGTEVTLFSSVSSADRNAARIRVLLEEDEAETATSGDGDSSAAAAAASDGDGGGGGLFGGAKSAILGVLATVASIVGIKMKWG